LREQFDEFETAWSERFRSVVDRVRRQALDQVAEILPRVPGMALHVDAPDGSSADETTCPIESPAWSWAEYFYRSARREIDTVVSEMESELAAR